MDPVVFIDPGYGKDWKFTDGERINSGGKPANPYAKISFGGNNCTAFCVNLDAAFAMTTLSACPQNAEHQRKLKFSVYCTEPTNSFSIGFATSTKATELDYFGITIGNGSYEIKLPPGITPSSGTLNGSISDGYHNISLLLYVSSTGTNAYTHVYRIAVDNEPEVYGTKSSSATIPVLYLVAWFPTLTTGRFLVSNVIFSCQAGSISEKVCDQKLIPTNTQLMPLKLGEPEDITFEKSSDKEGEYIGYVTGDKLLQTIDATDLINGTETTKGYGEGTKVDTVVVYGNPAYREDGFNKTVYGVFDGSKKKGFIYVNTSTDATYTVDLQTGDTTLGDINGKLAGWEIGGDRPNTSSYLA